MNISSQILWFNCKSQRALFHLSTAACDLLCKLQPCDCRWQVRGGSDEKRTSAGVGGSKEKQTQSDRGREGVQNPENFADVLNEWSLKTMVLTRGYPCTYECI